MKITQDEVVDRQTVLHIELEEEDLATYLDRGYRRVIQHTMIPGFRKGKAPRAVVERYLGRARLLNETLDYMVPDVTQRAIAEQSLETAGMPDIELLELEPVTLKATVALVPQVDLGAYQDIRVEENPIEVTEEDVLERLQDMQRSTAPWEPVDRPVKIGDMLNLRVVGTVEGRNILDEDNAVYIVEEEGALPFRGFCRHLEGAVVGVPRDFDLVISDDHHDTQLAGKEAHFTATVSEIKERKLPDLDDEFAKSVDDGFESLAALREAVERELKDKARDTQLAQFQQATMDELLKVATVEVPPLLVEHEVQNMVARRDQFVDRLNISRDDYVRLTGKMEEQSLEEMRERAVEAIHRTYALVTLAEREGLDVSDEEVAERAQAIEEAATEEAKRPISRKVDSEDMKRSIRETLIIEKALDRLAAIARAEVQEPSRQEQESYSETQNPENGGDAGDNQT